MYFSDEYGNLNNVMYQYNDQNYKNVAIVGGSGEGPERIYVTVGQAEGLDRRELFVDAKDIQKEELTDEEYKNLLIQRGQDKLNEARISESIEGETGDNIGFLYKEDYDLGDIVMVKKKNWGIAMKRRITEIQEIYENGALTIVPTIGEAMPETIDWEDK